MTGSAVLKVTASSGFPLRKTAGIPAGTVHLRWLGQAGFLVESRTLRILVDPYLSDSLAVKYRGKKFPHLRRTDIPVRPEDLHDIDLVLSTHGHSDHLDPGTVGVIAQGNPECRFIVPDAVRATALERGIPEDRLIGAEAGMRLSPSRDCAIDSIPSAHEELITDENGSHLYLGYILRLEGLSIYHSGDCCPYPSLAGDLRSRKIDLALLPVNGRDAVRTADGVLGNFSADEAVELVRDAEITFALGHHFGMFDFNTIDPVGTRKKLAETRPEMEGRFLLCDMESEYALSGQTNDRKDTI